MPRTISRSVRTRSLAGARSIGLLLAGCAGDDLLLPRDGDAGRAPRWCRATGRAHWPAIRVADPLVVEALDRAGRPVPGAVIVFEFVDPPTGRTWLRRPDTETDAPQGRASAEVTLGTGRRSDGATREAGTIAARRWRSPVRDSTAPGGADDGGGDGGDGGGGDDGGRMATERARAMDGRR